MISELVKVEEGNVNGIKKDKLKGHYQEEESKAVTRNNDREALEVDEIECNIDADIDDERYSGKNINDSFINKLKDFSSFNPSGNKGKEKGNSSMMVIPVSQIDKKKSATKDKGSSRRGDG